ncbi:MAG TPA: hypothetical protein VGN61_01635 [Verrucomicrobiae bacterium]
MRGLVLALIGFLAAAQYAAATPAEGVTFYVQLVRGSDADTPPAPGATLVGDVLGHRLRMFKWKNYWEVQRQTVQVNIGGKSRRRVTTEREVEISLSTPDDMTVCIYVNGKLSRKRKQHFSNAFYIAGGENEDANSWFIVVRRDKPQNSPSTQAQLPLRYPNQRAFGQLVVKRQEIAAR